MDTSHIIACGEGPAVPDTAGTSINMISISLYLSPTVQIIVYLPNWFRMRCVFFPFCVLLGILSFEHGREKKVLEKEG